MKRNVGETKAFSSPNAPLSWARPAPTALYRKAGHLTGTHSYAVMQPKKNCQMRSRATHASSKPP